MLLKKLGGQAFETELPMQRFESVPPARPIKDIGKAQIALVTSGGVVPKGNPDKVLSYRSKDWFKYSIKGLDDLTSDAYQGNHGGYDTKAVSEDPDRVLPLDMARELEREKAFGTLHDYFYTTAGAGTMFEDARRMGATLAKELKKEKVDAVILVST